MKAVLIFLLSLTTLSFSGVKNQSGQIKFDSDANGSAEMVLNSDKLGIGLNNPLSTLEVKGSLGFGFQVVSSNTTLSGNSTVFVNSSSDNITITLPYAGNVNGRLYTIKKASFENYVYLEGGGNLIDGATPIVMEESNSILPVITVMSRENVWTILHSTEIAHTVASTNLIGWWKLNETSGSTAKDSSENGYNGTLGSGVTFSDNGITGVRGRGLTFDGTDDNDYVDLGLEPGSSDSLTVCFWAMPTEVSYMQAISKVPNDATGLGWSFKYRNDGNVWWLIGSEGNSNTSSQIGASVYSSGNWHFMVGTFNHLTNTSKVYFDATLMDTTTGITQGTNNTTLNTRVTKSAGAQGGEEFGGYLDDVKIYNKELSLSEIQALYQDGP